MQTDDKWWNSEYMIRRGKRGRGGGVRGGSNPRESTFDVGLDERTSQMVCDGVISGKAEYIRILSSRLNTKR